MEKVEVPEEIVASMPPHYKLEVTKNSKGYNWVVAVSGSDIIKIKNDMLDLEEWAKSHYTT